MVSRTTLNFILDSFLLVVFVGLAWSFALFRFAFPPATTADGWTLWGLSYDEWASGQFLGFCLFALCVLLHVMLHWNWVCGVITSRLSKQLGKTVRWDDGTQTLCGVILLIILLHVIGGGVFAAMLFVASPT